jgi:hypothetical protein
MHHCIPSIYDDLFLAVLTINYQLQTTNYKL